MQRLVSLALAFALLLSSQAALAWGLDEVVAGIAQPQGGVARFTEIKYLAALDQPLRIQGEVRFTPPDQLQRLVTEPYQENMTVAGGMLSLQRGEQKPRELALDDHPAIAGFVNAFLATLAGDKALLEAHYELALQGDESKWTLTMTPRDTGLAKRVEQIRVAGAGQRLISFETRQANGDRSVMLFSLLAS
ncbi:MAG: LolA-related protein [Nevskiales bacterium]